MGTDVGIGLKGVKPPLVFGGRTRDCSPGNSGNEGLFATDAALRQVAAGVPWREAYHDVRDHLERLETEDADRAVLAKRHLGATNGLDWRMYAQRVALLRKVIAKRRRAFDAKITALLG